MRNHAFTSKTGDGYRLSFYYFWNKDIDVKIKKKLSDYVELDNRYNLYANFLHYKFYLSRPISYGGSNSVYPNVCSFSITTNIE